MAQAQLGVLLSVKLSLAYYKSKYLCNKLLLLAPLQLLTAHTGLAIQLLGAANNEGFATLKQQLIPLAFSLPVKPNPLITTNYNVFFV